MAGRVRLKPRFYVFLILFIAIIATIVVLLSGNGVDVLVTQGAVKYEKAFDAIIVRNEKVYETDDYSKLVFSVAEGDRVSKGAKIVEVYKSGYNNNASKDLIAVQTNIKKYVEENFIKNILEQDLVDLNTQIDEKLGQIESVLSGNGEEDLLVLEKQLKDLLNSRQILLKKKGDAENNTELKMLLQQEQALVDNIANWKTDEFAEDAGIVSFYCDGAENLLTPEIMKDITIQQINEIITNIGTGRLKNTDGKTALYRLVDNFKWYCVVIGDTKGIDEFKADTKFNISFEGVYDRPYEGRVLSVRTLEDGYIYEFEVVEDIGPMLGVRKAKMTLKRDFEGLKVPSKYIVEKDGVRGVNVRDADGSRFVPVEIIVNDGNEAIIQGAQGNEIVVGQKIV